MNKPLSPGEEKAIHSYQERLNKLREDITQEISVEKEGHHKADENTKNNHEIKTPGKVLEKEIER